MNMQIPPSLHTVNHQRRVPAAGVAVVLSLVLFLAQGCAGPAAFDSADQAADAAAAAIRAHDTAQLKKVLGADSDEIISSGDEVADRNRMDEFLKAYDEKHRVIAGKDGSMSLLIGKSGWPLPIPIVQTDGKWSFDIKAGREEILNRRIGRNELDAMQSCLAFLDAQREYASLDRDNDGLREYAAKFVSDPGKKNGLFWPTAENDPPSPLGPFAAAAAEEGYTPAERPTNVSRRPYHGYYFRILTAQGPNAPGGAMDYTVGDKLIGGFAIVAWPADYGNSGIMTFIMNHDGIVFQRDLGDDTAKIAASMPAYDPGPEWQKVEPGN